MRSPGAAKGLDKILCLAQILVIVSLNKWIKISMTLAFDHNQITSCPARSAAAGEGFGFYWWWRLPQTVSFARDSLS